MKKNAALAITACLALASLAQGPAALGGTRSPSSALRGSPDMGAPQGIAQEGDPMDLAEANRDSEATAAARVRKLKNKFAQLKPKWSSFTLPLTGNEQALQSKATIDDIFDRDMNARMQAEYDGRVAPYMRAVENPTRPPTQVEMMRYMEGQRGMVKWAMKEVGRDQLNDFMRRGDSSSGGMKFLNAAKSLSGSNEDAATRNLTPREKAEREARMPIAVAKEDAPIPTKLKTRLNLLKARGALTLQNPYVTAMVEGGAGSGENLAVEFNRDFRMLDMYSRVRYGVDESLLSMNLNKRITREISVDLSSEHWTGVKRSDQGEKSRESAKLIYSLGF